jgi:hypothetical protein
VTFRGAGTKWIIRNVALRQPPPAVDAIEVAVQPTPEAPRYFSHDDAELLLRGNAWRGAGAGRTYGMQLAAPADDRAKRLSFDLPVVQPGDAYADVVWTGTSAPGAPTTIGKCDGTDCASTLLAGRRSGPQQFGDRFDLRNEGRAAITLGVADQDGSPLLTAALPWPGPVGSGA